MTILLALPTHRSFAPLSIVIFKQSLNIFSVLGIVALFGIVLAAKRWQRVAGDRSVAKPPGGRPKKSAL